MDELPPKGNEKIQMPDLRSDFLLDGTQAICLVVTAFGAIGLLFWMTAKGAAEEQNRYIPWCWDVFIRGLVASAVLRLLRQIEINTRPKK